MSFTDIYVLANKTNNTIKIFIEGLIWISPFFLYLLYAFLKPSSNDDYEYKNTKMSLFGLLVLMLYFTLAFLFIYAIKYLYLYFIFNNTIIMLLNLFVLFLLILTIYSFYKEISFFNLFISLPVFLLLLYSLCFNFGINVTKEIKNYKFDLGENYIVIKDMPNNMLPRGFAVKGNMVPTKNKSLFNKVSINICSYNVKPKNKLSKLLGFDGIFYYFICDLYYKE